MMEKEEWRPARYYFNRKKELINIKGLEVSTLGNFRYEDSKKTLNVCYKVDAYPVIEPTINKIQKKYSVHVVMAATFLTLPEEESSRVVDHIDKNKRNFSISNLRYVTNSENLKNRNKFKDLSKYFILTVDRKVVNIIDSDTLSRDVRHSLNTTINKRSSDNEIWYVITKEAYGSLENDLNKLEKMDWKLAYGNYYVSNEGFIKILVNPHKIIVTLGRIKTNSGYRAIPYFKNKLGTSLVHRVIASVFFK